MSACIRQPHSTWTVCRCADCVILQRRTDKARRWGLLPTARTDEAWALVDVLMASGWTQGAIATVAGVPRGTMCSALQARDAGYRWSVRYAEMILSIDVTATPPAGYMSPMGTRRRLRALAAIGWSAQRIADHIAATQPIVLHQSTLVCLRRDGRKWIRPDVAEAVARTYPVLAGSRPAPGRSATAVMRGATRREWLPPSAYEGLDIDDPDPAIDEAAAASVRTPGTDIADARADRLDSVSEMWASGGHTIHSIAVALGVNDRTIERDLAYLREQREGAA